MYFWGGGYGKISCPVTRQLPSAGRYLQGGIKRDKVNGTNRFLRKSAVFRGFLQKSAVFCENLRLPNATIPRKSDHLQKSANICEKLQIWLRSSLFCSALLIPPAQRARGLKKFDRGLRD